MNLIGKFYFFLCASKKRESEENFAEIVLKSIKNNKILTVKVRSGLHFDLRNIYRIEMYIMKLICADASPGIDKDHDNLLKQHGLHNIGIWKFQYGIFGIWSRQGRKSISTEGGFIITKPKWRLLLCVS